MLRYISSTRSVCFFSHIKTLRALLCFPQKIMIINPPFKKYICSQCHFEVYFNSKRSYFSCFCLCENMKNPNEGKGSSATDAKIYLQNKARGLEKGLLQSESFIPKKVKLFQMRLCSELWI